jgi:3-mercaptopyruvate sulfurtransferase SseA
MEKPRRQSVAFWMAVAFTCLYFQSAQAVDFPEISATELKSKMVSGEKLVLINPLSDIEYSAKHIPGSINIPLQYLLISKKLPRDKNHLIVTYCLGRK